VAHHFGAASATPSAAPGGSSLKAPGFAGGYLHDHPPFTADAQAALFGASLSGALKLHDFQSSAGVKTTFLRICPVMDRMPSHVVDENVAPSERLTE